MTIFFRGCVGGAIGAVGITTLSGTTTTEGVGAWLYRGGVMPMKVLGVSNPNVNPMDHRTSVM